MTLQEAIKILDLYNKWRRDNDGKYDMPKPKEIGEAIDLVVSHLRENINQATLAVPSGEFIKNMAERRYSDEERITAFKAGADFVIQVITSMTKSGFIK